MDITWKITTKTYMAEYFSNENVTVQSLFLDIKISNSNGVSLTAYCLQLIAPIMINCISFYNFLQYFDQLFDNIDTSVDIGSFVIRSINQ